MKEHDEINDAPTEEFVDEMDFEPEEELGSIGAAQAKIKKLRAELKEAQQKRDEYLAGWQREKADAINMKKEAAHDAIRMAARVKEGLIEDLLPALDSFDMAYGSASWEAVDPTWRSGIDGIRNQLLDVLSKKRHPAIRRSRRYAESSFARGGAGSVRCPRRKRFDRPRPALGVQGG
jgi:molecular chaperone GrpE (heat shock protein)